MFREEVSDASSRSCCPSATKPTLLRLPTVRRREGPIWKLVTEQPMHLLDPEYTIWDARSSSRRATESITRAEREGGLARTVVRSNVTAYRHPLSPAIPIVGRWLDMPLQTAAWRPLHAEHALGSNGARSG